jgi:hypothetical protein
MSRLRADAAAAVIELVCGVWVGGTCELELARRKGSKCSLSRSNSRASGAESSYFCSCADNNNIELHADGGDVDVGLTCKSSRLFEGDSHFSRVPSAVITIEKKWRLSDSAHSDSSRAAIIGFLRIRWHN